MSLTEEEKKVFRDELDERYMKIRECEKVQKEIDKKLANDDKRIDMILLEITACRSEFQRGQKFNNWLTAAVLGVIIAGVLGFYFLNFGG